MIRKTTYIILAVAVGLIPLVPCAMGYGAYVRYLWPLALLFALPPVIGILVLILKDARRNPRPFWSRLAYIRALLVLLAAFVAGRTAGDQIRRFHCRRICRACDPLLAAAGEYYARHGEYPSNLESLRKSTLAEIPTSIGIHQGRMTEKGISTDILRQADAAVYLTPEHFLCVVPVERPFFMSITRFYVYARDIEDPDWTYCHFVWFLRTL